MDTNIQRALHDKLYDKRKVGALEYVPILAHTAPRLLSGPAKTNRGGTGLRG
jgi:hypothetical protein